MNNKKSIFETLFEINVNECVEKKNGLSYLSWAYAWAEVKKKFPTATYKIHQFGENHLPYVFDEGIDIENDRTNGNKSFVSSSKAGRILTEIGLQKVANTITKMIAQSMPQDENSKNVKSPKKV